MHLAAARRTLGILVSPARHGRCLAAAAPLSGGLACEPACRSQPGADALPASPAMPARTGPGTGAARLREIARASAPGHRDRRQGGPQGGDHHVRPDAGNQPVATPIAQRACGADLAIRLGGGFGDLLLAGRLIILWALAGWHGRTCDRPELAQQALGGRGLVGATRSLRSGRWPAASRQYPVRTSSMPRACRKHTRTR
jgi:hypothetical protein